MKTLLAFALAGVAAAQTFSGGAALDSVIDQAVHDGLIPGAVLIVAHDGQILYRKAYGQRALVPAREPMTVDTIFDAASLTKVIATTPSLMKLFEEGKFRIADPVTNYLPEFQGGKSTITIRDLMTHFSGLRPDLDLEPAWSGYDTGIARALIDKPAGPPGVRFVYSDINFELMGEIVRRLSGQPLDQFAREKIFQPLGMSDTMFRPPASLRGRIAPTEIDPATGLPLRGVVHDPTARYMGGVAGHAGMFTTADDLAKFANMMLENRFADFLASDDSQIHLAGSAAGSADPARARLGYRFALFVQSRRAVSHRLLWPYRLYGNVDLDRPFHQVVRDPDDELRSSQSRKESEPVACARCDDRGRGDRRGCSGRQRGRLQRN